MRRLNWFGKTFNSRRRQAAGCLDADGKKFSNTESMKGEASLWMEEFRGEVIATMVYDGQPMHDHFKKVDDNTVMGIMNGKAALKSGQLRLLLSGARIIPGIRSRGYACLPTSERQLVDAESAIVAESVEGAAPRCGEMKIAGWCGWVGGCVRRGPG